MAAPGEVNLEVKGKDPRDGNRKDTGAASAPPVRSRGRGAGAPVRYRRHPLRALAGSAAAPLSLTVLVLSVFAAAMVPIVQQSGEWLESQVGRSALLERHTQL